METQLPEYRLISGRELLHTVSAGVVDGESFDRHESSPGLFFSEPLFGAWCAGGEQDARVDVYGGTPAGLNRIDASVSPMDAFLRPAVVADDGRLIWGERYEPLWRAWPGTMYPVVDAGAVTAREALSLALQAENRCDAYRLSETARVVAVCDMIDADADADADTEVGAGDSGPARESSWNAIAPLVSSTTDVRPVAERFRALPATIRSALDDGIIDMRTAEAIPAELDHTVGSVLTHLRALSFSNRRAALRMVVELLRRDPDQTEELLSWLADTTPRDIVDGLTRRRYPTMTTLQDRLQAAKRRALAGTGVELKAPANFEGDRYTVTFQFKTREELLRRIDAIGGLKDEMDELLDLLF